MLLKELIQLKKDYKTGKKTFKKGSIGTVINATPRRDKKLKVKLDNDKIKFRLIKERDLQAYEGVAFLDKTKSQTNCQSNSTIYR